VPPEALEFHTKGGTRESTTLVVVATDAVLTKPQARRLVILAQTGLARALYPVHTPLDGDVVFSAATGRVRLGEPSLLALSRIGALAANVVARAIARAVFEAVPLRFPGALPAWQDRFRQADSGRTGSDGF
jgi:D-aminopeptidase